MRTATTQSGSEPRRWGRIVLVVVVALAVVGTVSAFAWRSPGYPQAHVDLSTSSVWTTNGEAEQVARVNTQIGKLDSSLNMSTGNFDVLQFDDQVLVVDSAKNALRPVDIARVVQSGQIATPRSAALGFGGTTLSVLDPASGKWWVGSTAGLSGLDPATSAPTLTTAPRAVTAVSVAGTAFAAAPGSDDLWSVALTDSGAPAGWGVDTTGKPVPPAPRKLAASVTAVSPTSHPQITAVGDEPVVLDPAAGLLLVGGQKFAVDDAADAVLQQPGPQRDVVLLETKTELVAYPLAGGQPVVLSDRGTGRPIAPVYLDGCAQAAWAGSASAVRQVYACDGGVTGDRDLHTAGQADPVFRVNKDVMVLNDRVSGDIWTINRTQTPLLIDNWSDVKQDTRSSGTNNSDSGESTGLAAQRANCGKQGAAVSNPKPAKFGLRAGRTTVLPVLNFVDVGDCSAIEVSKVTALPAADGSVSVVDGGRDIQVTVPSGVTSLPALQYTVDDGQNPSRTADLTLTVVPDGQAGTIANFGRSSATEVALNGTVTYSVLSDWYSTAGDDLHLSDARAVNAAEIVSFTPGGQITFRDTGLVGKQQVEYHVSDGNSTQTGKLTVDVQPDGSGKVIAAPVLAQSLTSVPVTVNPLAMVVSSVDGAVKLAAVQPLDKSKPASFQVNADGTVTLQATTVGTYFFGYTVSAGQTTAPPVTGVIRLDVRKPSTDQAPVAVADVVYLPDGDSVRVDPTANDFDPFGAGLAVSQIDASAQTRLTVDNSDLQTLQMASRGSLNASVSFHYTVSDGYKSAQGEIRVVPVEASASPPKPVAQTLSLKVRAGDAISIPAGRFASDARGQALRPAIVSGGNDVPGDLFATPTEIRYLAPTTAPSSPVKFSWTVTNTSNDTSDPAVVTLTVTDPNPTKNSAPNPPAPVTARVIVGKSTHVDLPLDGIDPDGDWVTVSGAPQSTGHLTQAVADASAGGLTIRGLAPGVDTLKYQVSDPYGKTADGSLSVIVVAAPNEVPALIAPDLTANVRPGKTISINPLTNGVVGEVPALDKPAFDAPAGWAVTQDGSALLISAGTKTSGTGRITYHVVDDRGQKSSGTITVTVSPDAPLVPPTASDVFVTKQMLTADGGTAVVDVAGSIANANGKLSQLVVSLSGTVSGRAVAGTKITVPLTTDRQVVAYNVTDNEKQSSTALLVVPAKAVAVPQTQPQPNQPKQQQKDLPPTPKSSAPVLTVKAGESTPAVAISDYVDVPTGATAKIPSGSALTAGKGTATAVDATHFVYTANANGSGTDYLTFTASVGTSDPVAVTVQITIIPLKPVLQGGQLQVQAGTSATLDLLTLVDPSYPNRNSLHFNPPSGGDGLTVSVNGSTLTVQAPATIPKGTVKNLSLTATDTSGQTSDPVQIAITVTGTQKPPPTLADQKKTGKPGQATTFDVNDSGQDSFGAGLSVLSAKIISGQGAASVAGTKISVTPSSGFIGDVVVSVTIKDGAYQSDPTRTATAKFTVTVKDKPHAPGTPTFDKSAETATSETLSWAWDSRWVNGGDGLGFTVLYNGKTQDCGTTPSCKISGLNPGTLYTFSVVATTTEGSSPASGSLALTPNALPDAPAAPTVTLTGDKQLTVAWTIPKNDQAFSPIRTATLIEMENGQPGATNSIATSGPGTMKFANLDIDTTYSFEIRVTNAKGSVTSDASAGQQPNTTPAPPTNVVLAFAADSHTVSASWDAPAPSDQRPAPTGYVVTYSIGGANQSPVSVSGRSWSPATATDGQAYQIVRVVAQNKWGSGDPSDGSNAVTPFSRPTAATAGATATGADNSVKLGATGATPSGRTGQYYFSTDGFSGGRGVALTDGQTLTTDSSGGTLTNGTTYTFSVRYCYPAEDPYTDAQLCGDAGSAQASPYGPVGSPANVHQTDSSQTQIRFDWDAPGSNGRPPIITRYRLDGGDWAGTSSDAHVSVAVGSWGCGQNHTISVRAEDSEGHVSGEATAGGSTAACPPPPNGDISKGSSRTIDSSCNNSSCHFLVYTLRNWPANTSVTCDPPYAKGDSATLTTDGSGYASAQNPNYYGYPSGSFSTTCHGGGYNVVISSPNPWGSG